jgi:leader peptidase (prepilin peptidase)/N-methyltransferase
LLLGIFFLPELLQFLLGRRGGVYWPHDHQPLPLLLVRRMLEAVSIGWFFFLGASFGSFLHCVVYRVPRGISVVARGSSCPGCDTPIKAWHNVPLFGWLWLRGKCAHCGWQIPLRYPLAEFLFGLVFVLLVVVEVVMSGYNLPAYAGPWLVSVAEMIWFPRWPLFHVYIGHSTLLLLQLTACLFAYDRVPVPRSVALLGFGCGIALPLLWPELLHVGTRYVPGAMHVTSATLSWAAVTSHWLGALLGGCCGLLLARRTPDTWADRVATCLALAWAGLFLSWPGVLSISLLTLLVRLLMCWRPSLPVAWWVALATVFHLVAWRHWLMIPGWPGGASTSGEPLVLLWPLGFMAAGALLERMEAVWPAQPPPAAIS